MLLCLALAGAPGVLAQSSPEPGGRDPPRVGLALGGGGARGIAHVGVLKVLEELRVPVSRVAGTSMGAVIGGLYAAGYTATELEQIVTSFDWVDLFDDDPPREQLSYRRKQEDRDDFIKLELGLDSRGLLLSRGLVEGHKLNLALRRLLAPLSQDLDFETLAVPFRALAMDIETGEAVVLARGDLARALHASMTVPGVFTPDQVDGRFLVDGGIANNLPVDVVKPLVDVVIAVDVSADLRSAVNLRTVVDVSDQVVNTIIDRNEQAQLALLGERDIALKPGLGSLTSGEFARAGEAVQAGYQAAAAVREQLAPLGVDAEAYAEYQADRRRLLQRTLVPGRVRVTTDADLDARILRARIRARPGRPLETGALHRDLEGIYGLDYFERVDYRLLEEDGQLLLDVSARQKAWGPNYLRFGVALQDDLQGGNSFDLSARLTRVPVNRTGAEWRNVVRVGQRPLASSELFQPLGPGSPNFAAALVEAGADAREVLLDDGSRTEYRINATRVSLDLGRQFDNVAEVRAGLFARRSRIAPRLDDPELDVVDRLSVGWRASLGFDTLNSPYFPSRGHLFELGVTASRASFGADESFNVLDLKLVTAHRWGPGTFIVRSEFSDLRNTETPLINLRPLGGFLNLSGLAPGELSGQNIGIGNLIWLRRLNRAPLLPVDNPVYLGVSLETGHAWQQAESVRLGDFTQAASVFLGADTVLGPAYVAFGVAESDQRSLYLYLGKVF